MAVSKAQFNKIQFEQLSSDPVLTAILNGDEVDSEQGKFVNRHILGLHLNNIFIFCSINI